MKPALIRRVNDYGAGLVCENPKQFGYLTTLALQDIEAGPAEIKRSYDELHVDGVVLHGNYEGVYLAFGRSWNYALRRYSFIRRVP